MELCIVVLGCFAQVMTWLPYASMFLPHVQPKHCCGQRGNHILHFNIAVKFSFGLRFLGLRRLISVRDADILGFSTSFSWDKVTLSSLDWRTQQQNLYAFRCHIFICSLHLLVDDQRKGVLVKYLFTNAYCLEILVKILKGSQGGQRATYLANPCTKSLGAQAKNHYRPTSSTSVHSQAPESTSVLSSCRQSPLYHVNSCLAAVLPTHPVPHLALLHLLEHMGCIHLVTMDGHCKIEQSLIVHTANIDLRVFVVEAAKPSIAIDCLCRIFPQWPGKIGKCYSQKF